MSQPVPSQPASGPVAWLEAHPQAVMIGVAVIGVVVSLMIWGQGQSNSSLGSDGSISTDTSGDTTGTTGTSTPAPTGVGVATPDQAPSWVSGFQSAIQGSIDALTTAVGKLGSTPATATQAPTSSTVTTGGGNPAPVVTHQALVTPQVAASTVKSAPRFTAATRNIISPHEVTNIGSRAPGRGEAKGALGGGPGSEPVLPDFESQGVIHDLMVLYPKAV